MDIKQAIYFGMDKKFGVDLANLLERNGFGIEVVNSRETETKFANNNITYIKSNTTSAKDIQDWYKRNEQHCAVVVLPVPLTAVTRSSFELVSDARFFLSISFTV